MSVPVNVERFYPIPAERVASAIATLSALSLNYTIQSGGVIVAMPCLLIPRVVSLTEHRQAILEEVDRLVAIAQPRNTTEEIVAQKYFEQQRPDAQELRGILAKHVTLQYAMTAFREECKQVARRIVFSKEPYDLLFGQPRYEGVWYAMGQVAQPVIDLDKLLTD